jgi:hypothetical protein
MNSRNKEQPGAIEKSFKRDDRQFRKANSPRARHHNDQKGRQVVTHSKTIQFKSRQPEDCDNIQWPALEIMSVQPGDR